MPRPGAVEYATPVRSKYASAATSCPPALRYVRRRLRTAETASVPVGRPPETAGTAAIVSASAYPLARSSRTTTVGPVGVPAAPSQPG